MTYLANNKMDLEASPLLVSGENPANSCFLATLIKMGVDSTSQAMFWNRIKVRPDSLGSTKGCR
jgi:hypothetical protein